MAGARGLKRCTVPPMHAVEGAGWGQGSWHRMLLSPAELPCTSRYGRCRFGSAAFNISRVWTSPALPSKYSDPNIKVRRTGGRPSRRGLVDEGKAVDGRCLGST